MALDHYVSQVHLKNFYSPELENFLYAIRKKDLKVFKTNAKSVCRIEDNSTNSYLREDRAIEEFLKGLEPNYNTAVTKIEAGEIDADCIYVIAGFIAYVLTCSPGGMRIQSDPLKGSVEESARILDSKGLLPAPPPVLEAKNLTELLNNNKAEVEIDPKYPQALGITSILSYTSMFGNFKWEILRNPFHDNPFFTSDFPVAIEKTDDLRVSNRIVPLTPNLAIRIHPDISLDRKRDDFTFSDFRYIAKKLSHREVTEVNRMIVRCAETTVFFRDNYDWVSKFVKKNSGFRIEPHTHRLPTGDGTLLVFTQDVRETRN